MTRFRWARVLTTLVGCVAVMLAAAHVVGTTVEIGLVVAVGTGAALAVVTLGVRRAKWMTNLLAATAAAAAAAIASAWSVDDGIRTIPGALIRGPKQLLTTEWPSPRLGTILIFLSVLTAIASYVAVALSGRLRWRLTPIVPLIAACVALVALGAVDGPQWDVVGLLALCAVGLGLLQPNRAIKVSFRSALGLAVAASLATGAVAANASALRADPRSSQQANDDLDLVDPVAEVIAQRSAVTPVELFRVSTANGVLPRRWRTAALTVFNGEAWQLGSDLRLIGVQVSQPIGPVIDAQITVVRADQRLLISPGQLVSTGLLLKSDADRQVFLITDDRRPITTSVEVTPLVELADSYDGQLGIHNPTDLERAYTDLARSLAGQGTAIDQLRALDAALTTNYTRADDRGGGLQMALLERFLRDTRRGTAEQFVTGMVVLSRSLGISARVATGYDLAGGTAGSITTAQATMWAEVQLADGTWVAIDVVPETSPPEPQPPAQPEGGQVPPAAQPPDPAQVNPTEEDVTRPPVTETATQSFWQRVRAWGTRAVLAVFAMIGVVSMLLLTVVGAKSKRRFGLRNGDPNSRIRLAWALAADGLVDAGVQLPRNATNDDITKGGTTSFGSVAEPLAALRRLADRAAYTTRVSPVEYADLAVALLDDIEQKLRGRGRFRDQLRWILNPRSLLRRSRSPLRAANAS